jgi:hypothetical protein
LRTLAEKTVAIGYGMIHKWLNVLKAVALDAVIAPLVEWKFWKYMTSSLNKIFTIVDCQWSKKAKVAAEDRHKCERTRTSDHRMNRDEE